MFRTTMKQFGELFDHFSRQEFFESSFSWSGFSPPKNTFVQVTKTSFRDEVTPVSSRFPQMAQVGGISPHIYLLFFFWDGIPRSVYVLYRVCLLHVCKGSDDHDGNQLPHIMQFALLTYQTKGLR